MPISLQSDVTILPQPSVFSSKKIKHFIILEKSVNDYTQCLQVCNETGILLNRQLHCKLAKLQGNQLKIGVYRTNKIYSNLFILTLLVINLNLPNINKDIFACKYPPITSRFATHHPLAETSNLCNHVQQLCIFVHSEVYTLYHLYTPHHINI